MNFINIISLATLLWIAQFADRVIVALWPLWFANIMLRETPDFVEAPAFLPFGKTARRKLHLMAAVLFTLTCNFLNLWQIPVFCFFVVPPFVF